eukprot:scaffold94293_cov22-Tisochrysis_lutea.AAC.1
MGTLGKTCRLLLTLLWERKFLIVSSLFPTFAVFMRDKRYNGALEYVNEPLPAQKEGCLIVPNNNELQGFPFQQR